MKVFNIILLLFIFVCFSLIFLYIPFTRTKKQSDIVNCITFIDVNKIDTLSDNPRIYLYHNFISKKQRDYLIRLAGDDLKRSNTRDRHGNSIPDNDRTSSGKMMNYTSDYVLRSLEERIAKWTQIPSSNGEYFFYLTYQIGQEYKPHHDSFDPNKLEKAGIDISEAMGYPGPRICTVLLYLKAPQEGGETQFPNINLTIPIESGDALLFWTYDVNHTFNNNSLHAGLPVQNGEKIVLTKWIRENVYQHRKHLRDSKPTIPF